MDTLTVRACGRASNASGIGISSRIRSSKTALNPGPPAPQTQAANGEAARSAASGDTALHSHGVYPGAALAPSDAKKA